MDVESLDVPKNNGAVFIMHAGNLRASQDQPTPLVGPPPPAQKQLLMRNELLALLPFVKFDKLGLIKRVSGSDIKTAVRATPQNPAEFLQCVALKENLPPKGNLQITMCDDLSDSTEYPVVTNLNYMLQTKWPPAVAGPKGLASML